MRKKKKSDAFKICNIYIVHVINVFIPINVLSDNLETLSVLIENDVVTNKNAFLIILNLSFVLSFSICNICSNSDERS